MRAAAIIGPGTSERNLRPFRAADPSAEWTNNPATADAILLFGGDGTLHHHLTGLVNLAKPVLIVPTGSGNDFARALNLRSASDSLAAWKEFLTKKSSVRTIDLGIITPLHPVSGSSSPGSNTSEDKEAKDDRGCATSRRICEAGEQPPLAQPHPARYFATVAALGLDAEVARRANTLPRW